MFSFKSDETDHCNQQVNKSSYNRPLYQQEVRDPSTRIDQVEWRVDLKPDPNCFMVQLTQ